MTSLKYKDKDGFWQELQVGTNVVANPIIAGTESELTGLQVGNVKYKSGGGKLYMHSLLCAISGISETSSIIVYVYNTSGDTITSITNIPENYFYSAYIDNGNDKGFGYIKIVNSNVFLTCVVINNYTNTNTFHSATKITVSEVMDAVFEL